MPSRDGTRRAKLAGSPRDHIEMGTLRGFPCPPAMVRGERSSPAPTRSDWNLQPRAPQASRARVEAVVHRAQVSAREMRVDLGGSDVGMAEHGLHGAQIGAPFHQVGGEGMAKLVR